MRFSIKVQAQKIAGKLLKGCTALMNRRLALLGFDMAMSLGVGVFFLLLGAGKHTAWDRALALVILLGLVYAARLLLRVYHKVWQYAGTSEYLLIVLCDLIGGVAYMLGRPLLPRAIWIRFLEAMSIVTVGCLASLSVRFAYKYLYRELKIGTQAMQGFKNGLVAHIENVDAPELNKINVAIVGAGSVGTLLAQELQINPEAHYRPYCFIDTDKKKIGNDVAGLRVYPEDGIVERLKTLPVQEVIVAMPGLNGEKRQRLYDIYKETGCKVKIYDAPFQEDGEAGRRTGKRPVLREFEIEDLLFREPIRINDEKTGAYYRGKTVMITGGGGSIGSELCRQIAKFGPKRLVIFDIYENNAYDIQQEMKQRYGASFDLCVEISSVREAKRVNAVMAQYRPDIVIHAAAHKHVPLMEHNCADAVKNNVFGTYNVANAAEQYGVKKFIMISTDKAVNPTNVMGATKRMCEMIVQSRRDSATEFTAVRFGNVLGSNGSVIPLFKRQIASGGPVTITDKRIIRYFMTIPEAAQLVLEAGSMAQNGELYVLDMGKPVRILQLAEDMIRLSGLTPYKDIDIREVGLRPGEKLYEELLVKNEELDKTENEMIFIERDKGLPREEVERKLLILKNAVADGAAAAVRAAMKRVVPTYHDPDEVNLKAAQTEEMRAVDPSNTMAG